MKHLVVAILLGAAVAAPGGATTFVRVADEELVAQARLVVVGTVLSRAGARGLAATDYRLRIEETLAGDAPAELVVRVPSGGEGPVRRKIWGAPGFRPGERVLLFLGPAADGERWRVLHLFLGSFHQLRAGERTLAVRDLSEVREVRLSPAGHLLPVPRDAEPLRDFAAFARWVRARGQGGAAAVDYRLAEEEARPLRAVAEKATWFVDPDDGRRMRWFTFDGGGHVDFRALQGGQSGLAGGGFDEFKTALQAWNAESQTPIDYRYDGTTPDSTGLQDPQGDLLNSIVFNDPKDLIDPFSCAGGGTLAIGGPYYEELTQLFRGERFHPIAEADIVISDGISCFFASSPNAKKAAEELFAHELGHTLGLAHSCGDPVTPACAGGSLQDDALMRAFVHDDARGAKLGGDDLAGIRSLYNPTAQGALPAAPTGLVASPVAGTTNAIHLAWVDNATDETAYVVEYAALGEPFAALPDDLPANATSADVVGLAPATGYQFRVRARNATGSSGYSNVASAATNAPIAPCVEGGTTLCLNNDRFAVKVAWETAAGESGTGTAVPLAADDSGLFWFFGPDNLEMLIKVLDACVPPFDRFWVFFAATTDVEFETTVIDTQTGAVTAYFNPLGNPADAVTDTNAFATCP